MLPTRPECVDADNGAVRIVEGLVQKAGVRHGDVTSFGDALAANGFVRKHKKTGNGYEGLRIQQDDDLPL